MTDADTERLCIFSKEDGTPANRPQLTVNYSIDTTPPAIASLNPTTGMT
jgi:hypothetical protein